MNDVIHGMVIVGQVFAGGELVVTCMCGWFSSETPLKVDMSAMLWRDHMLMVQQGQR